MRRLVLLLFLVAMLTAGAVPAIAAPAEGLEIIDLPPIDISRGDWWVPLVMWFLVRYMNSRNGRTR